MDYQCFVRTSFSNFGQNSQNLQKLIKAFSLETAMDRCLQKVGKIPGNICEESADVLFMVTGNFPIKKKAEGTSNTSIK